MPHLQFRVIECKNFQLIIQKQKSFVELLGGVLAPQRHAANQSPKLTRRF